jgi:hypothetical protein
MKISKRLGVRLSFLALFLLPLLCGCTVVSANRVFPKLTWYWTVDAKLQRESDASEAAGLERWKAQNAQTNTVLFPDK